MNGAPSPWLLLIVIIIVWLLCTMLFAVWDLTAWAVRLLRKKGKSKC